MSGGDRDRDLDRDLDLGESCGVFVSCCGGVWGVAFFPGDFDGGEEDPAFFPLPLPLVGFFGVRFFPIV